MNRYYWLMDEARYNIGKTLDTQNIVTPLIALEQCGGVPEKAAPIVSHLTELLQQPEHASLRRAYTVYIKRVFKAKEAAPNLDVNDLHEVPHMLAEVEQWANNREARGIKKGEARGIKKGEARGIKKGKAEGMKKGEAEGMKKGKAEGMKQGEIRFITRLLQRKFGKLPAKHIKQLQSMSSHELLQLSEQLLTAGSLEDLFATTAAA